MSTVQTFGLIAVLATPYLLVAALTWTAHRKGYLRLNRDQFRWAAPMVGRLAGSNHVDDRDASRTQHDFEAIRSRFEHQPVWPASGALGERR